MSKQNVVLKLDKQWYDALSSRLKEKGTTAENQLCECFDMMLNQLPAPVYERISREIWEEEQRRTAAEHRVSALRITQDGQTDCLLTQGRGAMGAMGAMCVAECLRNYLLLRGNTSLRFVQGLINGEDVTPEEFEHHADDLREGMGLATTVLDIDLDRGEFSVLDTVNGWETYDSIYADDELGHRAKAVYIYLKDHTNKEGTCWPGINTIAAGVSLSRSTVKRALGDLVRAGLVVKEKRWRGNGSLTSNLYQIQIKYVVIPIAQARKVQIIGLTV